MDEIDYRLSEIFEALGNGIRLNIVILIDESPRSVKELSGELDRPMQTVSRHLKKLRDKDLLEAESSGRRRIYEVKRPKLIEECLALRSYIQREDE